MTPVSPPAPPSPPAAPLGRPEFAPSIWSRGRGIVTRRVLEIVLLVLCVYLTFKTDTFLTRENLLNVLRNISIQGVVALGMTMVIIAGEIDLSVGSMVAFSGCIAAWVVQYLSDRPQPMAMPMMLTLGIATALVASAVVGMATGWLRAAFAVPTFISTLAWFTVLRGVAQLVTNGFPINPFPDAFSYLGSGFLLGVPFPAVVFLVAFAVVAFVMNNTPFGRAVYAVGGNAEAARLSGIRVRGVRVAVMAIVALLAAFAGIVQAAQNLAGSGTAGTGWELDVISAVIIGGTSLAGGAGGVWGTLIGLVFLGVLVNGMTILDISEYWQSVVRGGLILLAVLVNVAPGRRQA